MNTFSECNIVGLRARKAKVTISIQAGISSKLRISRNLCL